MLNPLSTKLIKWQNTLKQSVGNLVMNCLSVFGYFVGLALKGLKRREPNLLRKFSFGQKCAKIAQSICLSVTTVFFSEIFLYHDKDKLFGKIPVCPKIG